ncbi:hypothetical protein KCU80_g50, partial [Aureobasidium melanogenum]
MALSGQHKLISDLFFLRALPVLLTGGLPATPSMKLSSMFAAILTGSSTARSSTDLSLSAGSEAAGVLLFSVSELSLRVAKR